MIISMLIFDKVSIKSIFLSAYQWDDTGMDYHVGSAVIYQTFQPIRWPALTIL